MYKYFYTDDYAITSIAQYTGALIDVKVQQSPSYAIYLTTAAFSPQFYQLDENGGIIRTGDQDLYRIAVADNGYVYGTETNRARRIHKFNIIDLADSPKDVDTNYYSGAEGMKFSSFNRLIYVADTETKWINAYDLDINRIPESSINLNSFSVSPSAIALYNSGSNHLIYVGFQDGSLRVFDQLTGQIINPTDSTNFGDLVYDMLISESEGYLVVVLVGSDSIQLWETDGITHTNTNKALTVTAPSSIDMDQNGRLLVVSNFNTLMIFS